MYLDRFKSSSRAFCETLPQTWPALIQDLNFKRPNDHFQITFPSGHKDPHEGASSFLHCKVLNIWRFSGLSEVSEHDCLPQAHSWAGGHHCKDHSSDSTELLI